MKAATGIPVTQQHGASMRERLTPPERIRRRPDFQQVYERGTRLHGRLMTLFLLPNCLPVARLGVAATKKLGRAVQRNRAKRLIREIFRRNKPEPGVDLVVVPRRELLDAPLTSLEADYRSLLARRHVRQRTPQ